MYDGVEFLDKKQGSSQSNEIDMTEPINKKGAWFY